MNDINFVVKLFFVKSINVLNFNDRKINSDQSYESVKIQLINILIYLNSYI